MMKHNYYNLSAILQQKVFKTKCFIILSFTVKAKAVNSLSLIFFFLS